MTGGVLTTNRFPARALPEKRGARFDPRRLVSARRAASAAPFLAAALAAVLPPPALADPVDELAAALDRVRGLGRSSVSSYRVPLTLPDDESAHGVALEECWRAPSTLVIRARDASAPGAVVRSLALYLEPLYVARTAILDLEWTSIGENVRAVASMSAEARKGGRAITVDLPEGEPSDLPPSLQDVDRIEAALDGSGRLLGLEVLLRDDQGTVRVECDYDARGSATQPVEARWTLPSGDEVVVRTKYRREGGVVVPSVRQVTFPSRFDPKETEEILVEYGAYELNAGVSDSLATSRGSFRYDANGLVSNR